MALPAPLRVCCCQSPFFATEAAKDTAHALTALRALGVDPADQGRVDAFEREVGLLAHAATMPPAREDAAGTGATDRAAVPPSSKAVQRRLRDLLEIVRDVRTHSESKHAELVDASGKATLHVTRVTQKLAGLKQSRARQEWTAELTSATQAAAALAADVAASQSSLEMLVAEATAVTSHRDRQMSNASATTIALAFIGKWRKVGSSCTYSHPDLLLLLWGAAAVSLRPRLRCRPLTVPTHASWGISV